MKRVLSLLLLVPFLTTQAWAILGGPFDGLNGRSQAALAGTYGVILSGNVLKAEKKMDGTQDPSGDNPETTGIMAMSVPGAGMASGRILIFAQGLMYLGNAQGMVDRRNNSVSLVSQVSHYVSRVVSDGITTRTGVTIDAVLSGKMNLSMRLDYMSGLIELDGSASYYRSKTLMTELTLETNNSTAGNNAESSQNKNQTQVASENANASQTASALQSEASDTTDTKALNQSANSTTTNTVTNPDGSTTSTTDTTGTTANNVSGTSTNSNSLSSDSRDSNLNKNSSLTVGTVSTAETAQTSVTTITTTKYKPELVEAQAIKLAFMDLTATGVRQDTTVEPIAPFTPPSQATGFLVDMVAPQNGGAPRTGN
jgi:hypothetical protein